MVVTSPTNTTKSCTSDEDAINRRSANYKPNQWDIASIQALKSHYTEEAYGSLAMMLKEEVRLLFDGIEPLAQVRLIHTIKRLGLGYHFEKEINGLLNALFSSGYHKVVQKNGLDDTAVLFMLLRQHGFMVSEEIFNNFKDDDGGFAESLSQEVKGLLGLYQASYHSFNGEITLDEAREFAIRHLKVLDSSTSTTFAREVSHALDLPSHWRIQRLQVRQYIDTYEITEGMNSTLLRLAKLDFNMVQSVHQRELINILSWWKSLGLGKKLSFARDRILECFFFAVNIIFQPQFESCLEWLPKVGALIVTLDDVYDVYGSFGELEIFTGVIDRWEIEEVENLPEYMKICFAAICNSVNEIANNIEGPGRWEIVCRLKKVAELERGDTPTSIQCYMSEEGVSEIASREHMSIIILQTWKEMNQEFVSCSSHPWPFTDACVNLARMAVSIYHRGDGFGIPDHEMKESILSLLMQPISVMEEDLINAI